ncbi:flagellar basal body protein, partial [Xanthomonas perforans]
MGFNTSLSGINAANADLNVTSNNIANVNTTGFKESRAEFADMFQSTSYG